MPRGGVAVDPLGCVDQAAHARQSCGIKHMRDFHHHAAVSTPCNNAAIPRRSEEHTSELQSLMRISYAVFCLKKTKKTTNTHNVKQQNHKDNHKRYMHITN